MFEYYLTNIGERKVRGIILHGGYGTRLRPLTFTGPKQLIPVANKPISQYVLEDLREASITDIAIILGNVYPEKVKEYYGDGSQFNSKITYIYQREPKGIAHAIGLCESFVGKDKFVVYLGDNLLKGGIKKFVERFQKDDTLDALILLTQVKEPQRFGVARFDEKGKLAELIEKPKVPPSNYALAGIYFFAPIIFDAIKELKPSWRSEFEITEAIQILLSEGYSVGYDFIEGWWKDTGTFQDILEANRLVLDDKIETRIEGMVEDGAIVDGRVLIDKGTLIKKGSVVRGPVCIGESSVIGPNAYIGPYTSIGRKCRIENSEVENAVILDEVEMLNLDKRVTDSLIGSQCQIIRANSKPAGYRLTLGERSYVEM